MRLALSVTLALSAVAAGIHYAGGPPLAVFLVAAVALVGWSYLLGEATEDLALTLGGAAAAVINVTFSNATELIVTLFALSAGLLTVVQASLVGSILGNLLLLQGASYVAAGARSRVVKFETGPTSVLNMMLALATAAMVVIAGFAAVTGSPPRSFNLSLGVAPILLVLYGLTVLFLLRNHNRPSRRLAAEVREAAATALPRSRAIALLVLATAMVAFLSELLVGSLAASASILHVGQAFIGLVLVPLVGNVAENTVAVRLAWRGDIDLSLGISMGSSLQIALFLAPLLVLLSPLLGHPMSLAFPAIQVLALAVAVVSVVVLSADGESNWLEGSALIGVYAVIAGAFLFL